MEPSFSGRQERRRVRGADVLRTCAQGIDFCSPLLDNMKSDFWQWSRPFWGGFFYIKTFSFSFLFTIIWTEVLQGGLFMKRRKNYGIGRTKSRPGKGKQAAALALCVSLWMAGGSVAGATKVTVEDAYNPSGLTPTSGYTVYGIDEATGCILNIAGGNSNNTGFNF